jgi:hypothetical protein
MQMTNNTATAYPPFQHFSPPLADNFGFGVQAADFGQQTPMTPRLSSVDTTLPPAISGFQSAAFDHQVSMAPMASMPPEMSSADNRFVFPNVGYPTVAHGFHGQGPIEATTTQQPSNGPELHYNDAWFFDGNVNGNGNEEFPGGN